MAVAHEPVTQFDHHSAEFTARHAAICATLRRECPVSWTNAHDGYWVVASRDLAAAAFKDYETFSSAHGAVIPDLSLGNSHIPITIDPPEFFAYRQFLQPRFSKGAIRPLEEVIRRTIRELIRGVVTDGSWDFVHDVAEVVPARVTFTLLGMDLDRCDEFAQRMARGMENAGTHDPDLLAQIGEDRVWLHGQVVGEIEKRRDAPSDDMISYLVNAPFGDRFLTDPEIIDITMNLFIGGFHTTSAGFAAAIMHFDAHPEHRRAVIADPDLLGPYIEEILRVYPPATGMARTVTRQSELGGVSLAAGDKVLLSILSANRDAAVFAHPEDVDISNDTTAALTWGWGVHRCIGIHLARLMLRTELETVLDLVPNYTVDRERVKLVADISPSFLYKSIPVSVPAS